jgi:4a-hydroxytetrahydrobiopterin dehydratase
MWQETDNQLYRRFEFKDFKEAFHFIGQVAEAAEAMNHHPTIHNTYNVVELWLSTHSAGNVVTAKDRALAAEIDKRLGDKSEQKT